MSVFHALVLGIIQGLTEFIPVSSSGHLALAPWLLGWPEGGLAFDVALHVGTLVAVIWYFNQEWRMLVEAGVSMLRLRRVETPQERRVVFLVIATIPGALGGLLLEDLAETVFRAPVRIATNLILFGTVLWLVDKLVHRVREMDMMRHRDALLIGLAQVLALMPGVSRSGSTITAGRALGLTREASAVFSFLMIAPITLGATVMKVPQAVREAETLAPLLVGVVASAIAGWLAIAVLLKYVARHSYGVFALYRWVLGLFILGVWFTRG